MRRILTVLLLVASTGCSRNKVLTPDDLKSQLTTAISFAAEEQMFIDYIRRSRYTHDFAEQHAAYLDAEIARSAHELSQAVPQPAIESQFQKCRTQLNQLRDELTGVRANLRNDPALAATNIRLEKIRHDLEQAKSSL